MNDPHSPDANREQIEAQLTALLLGELSREDAAAIRRALEHNAELARMHDRLAQTIELVREATANSVEEAAIPTVPRRLSDERRQKLLQQFRIVAPKELAPPKRREMPWYIPMSIAATIVALIGIVGLIPEFSARSHYSFASLTPRANLISPRSLATASERMRSSEDRRRTELFYDRNSSTVGKKEGELGRGEPATGSAANSKPPRAALNEATTKTVSDNPGSKPALGAIVLPSVPTEAKQSADSAVRWKDAAGEPLQLAEGRAPGAMPLPSPDTTRRASESGNNRSEFGLTQLGQTKGKPDATDDRVPVLGDLPMLGRAFGNQGSIGVQGGTPASGPTAAAGLLQDGRMLMEMGKVDEAETKLREALRENPSDQAAGYYLSLAGEARNLGQARKREISAKEITMTAGASSNAFPRNYAVMNLPQEQPLAQAPIDFFSMDTAAVPGLQALNDAAASDVVNGEAKPAGGAETRTAGVNTVQLRGADSDVAFNKRLSQIVIKAASGNGPTQLVARTPLQDSQQELQPPGVALAFGGNGGAPSVLQAGRTDAESNARLGYQAGPSQPQSVAGTTLGVPLVAALPAPALKTEEPLGEDKAKKSAEWMFRSDGGGEKGKPANIPELAKRDLVPTIPNGHAKAGIIAQSLSDESERPHTGQSVSGLELASKDAPIGAQKSSNQPLAREEFAAVQFADQNAEGLEISRKASEAKPQGAPNQPLLYAGKERRDTEPAQAAVASDLESPKALAVTDAKTPEAIVQTLEPETVPGLEREQITALKRAGQFEDQLNRAKETKLSSRAELDGLATQVEAQRATAKDLSDEIAKANNQGAALSPQYNSYFGVNRTLANGAGSGGDQTPENTPIKIVAPAQAKPDKPATLWDRLSAAVSGSVERAARVEVKPGWSREALLPSVYDNGRQATFDPYFIQTESEQIKSKMVLYKVIEKLHLNEEWGREHGGGAKLTTPQTYPILAKNVEVRQVPNTGITEIRVKSDKPEEAALIANTIAEVYRDTQDQLSKHNAQELAQIAKKAGAVQEESERISQESKAKQADVSPPKLAASAPIQQPEIQTRENAFSTFSMNVSDVSFKLAAASLEKGLMPDPATVRGEEFINAFDYRDPEAAPGVPIAFAWERARYPFGHNRDVLRFSIKTAAQGRQTGYPLNLVLLLDKSGSMERADRVQIVREALKVLAGQLQPQDRLSVVTFARTARLWADGVPGSQAGQVVEQVAGQTPEGGTNLEDALNLAYQTALRHYIQNGGNRVVLLTDGAANLGNVEPDSLKRKVEAQRKQGVALDCFGIGWEGFNDDLLEVLSSSGDGRYGFLNTPEEAAVGFAGQLAGALRVAASDVKVQVEFNPKRATAYRQIGYAKHQLTKEQFRDNTVDAAEIGAAEAGNALYVTQVDPRGQGEIGVVRVRYKEPSTGEYREHEWVVPYSGSSKPLEEASPAMRLAVTASAFSEWLASSPFAEEVTPDRLLGALGGVPQVYGADPRPQKLEWMIRQAKRLSGK